MEFYSTKHVFTVYVHVRRACYMYKKIPSYMVASENGICFSIFNSADVSKPYNIIYDYFYFLHLGYCFVLMCRDSYFIFIHPMHALAFYLIEIYTVESKPDYKSTDTDMEFCSIFSMRWSS